MSARNSRQFALDTIRKAFFPFRGVAELDDSGNAIQVEVMDDAKGLSLFCESWLRREVTNTSCLETRIEVRRAQLELGGHVLDPWQFPPNEQAEEEPPQA